MTTATPPDEPGVRISLATIYDLLLQVQRQVADLGVHRQNDAEDIRDLMRRTAALEESRWPLKQVAALTAVGGVIVGVFGLLITVVVQVL